MFDTIATLIKVVGLNNFMVAILVIQNFEVLLLYLSNKIIHLRVPLALAKVEK